jgi:hypothetical protein
MTEEVRGRLTFNFPTPSDGFARLRGFVAVALSSASGINESDIIVEDIKSRLDSRKTVLIVSISAPSEGERWERIARLRKAICDPKSELNSIGHMKKVFTGALFEVFEPEQKTRPAFASNPVRYHQSAPLDNLIVPRAPSAESASPRKSPKHRLPPDAVHIPFDLVLIPPGAKSPPLSPKREMHMHLPRPTSTVDEVDPVLTLDMINMKPLLDILNSPAPSLPNSLLSHELTNT